MTWAVETDSLSFFYAAKRALADVSLSVAEGERVAILGPNGSGKSTLLKILCAVLKLQFGEVRLLGKSLRSYNRGALSRTLAVVPQETHLAFPYTVAEVVLMGRASHLAPFALESRRDLEIARQSLQLTDTLSLADRYLHELSSGEKQRVILARALAQEPKILLLDEPTTFLDIRHQLELHALIVDLSRRRGLTVISALHDLNLASLYFPKLVLLREGAVYCSGGPAEVLTEETIRKVYGAQVQVLRNGAQSKPQILPIAGDNEIKGQKFSP